MLDTAPTKFIGRRATPCRKCNSPLHYVNPMGGVSCLACYPPKRPEHVTLRLICEAGVWTTEEDAFFVADAESVVSAGTSTADGVTSSSRRPPPAADQPRQTIRRKSSDDYTAAEIDWFFRPGGLLEQMDEAAGRRPYKVPVCRSGETIEERQERLEQFRLGLRGFAASRKSRSDYGAIPAELTEPLEFVVASKVIAGRVKHDVKVFPAGESCLIFPGREFPKQDPQAANIADGLLAKCDQVGRFVVIRLDDRLRIVSETSVRICG